MKYLREYYEIILKHGQRIGNVMFFVVFKEQSLDIDFAYVYNFEIDEPYRNQGIGTHVLKELCYKYGNVYLIPSNPDSKRLYERLGEKISYEQCPEIIRRVFQEYGVCYLLKGED